MSETSTRPGRPGKVPIAVLLWTALLVAPAGCDPAAGSPTSTPTSTPASGSTAAAPADTAKPGGSPTPHSPATPTSDAAPETYQGDVDAALHTVVQYWQETFAAHQRTFQPVKRVVPYRGGNGPRCGQEQLSAKNAAYCTGADYIGYDDAWLAEQWRAIGDTFVYFVIGHEYGHAVQARLGLTAPFTIKSELQADCFAGAYLRGSVDAGRLALQDGDVDELFEGVAAVGDRDGVGWFDAGAHGSANQRRAAFFTGYLTSVKACTTGL